RAGEQSRYDAREPTWRIDQDAVDMGQYVAGFDTGCCSWILVKNFIHQDSFAFLDAELACQLRRERLYADTQPASCHTSLSQQLFHHLLGHIGGNREPDPLGKVYDGGIDADDFAAQIEEWAT